MGPTARRTTLPPLPAPTKGPPFHHAHRQSAPKNGTLAVFFCGRRRQKEAAWPQAMPLSLSKKSFRQAEQDFPNF